MLKNKSVVKMISVVLAIVLWAYVIGEVNPTVKKTVSDIPVELTNTETLADRDLALQGDEEYFATVVVEGARSELNELRVADIHITADMYGYELGENHVSLDVTLPDGISLEELKTPEITVTLERLEEKSLPVTVVFAGESGENLEPSYSYTVPAEVEVRGAESVIAKVAEVRVQLDVNDLSETWEIYSEVPTAWSKDGKLIKNVTISAQSVEVEAVMFHTKQVPLELKVTGTPDDKYGDADIAIPKEVVVKGSAYTLERVTSISADSIDISDVKKNCTVKVVPHLPGGVELAEESKNIGVKIEFK
jgi:YbbR domain-containing protein